MAVPRKRPRQERSRETVAAILEAAAQLFGAYGYAATTTNKIAERAGVSIGSLYQYFPNKDALLIALAEDHLDEATHQTVTAIQTATARLTAPPPASLPDRADADGPPESVRGGDAAAARRDAVAGLLRGVLAAVAAPHTDRPELHALLFTHAARVPELVERFRDAERTIAAAVAPPLRRLGVGGSDPELTALLLVQGAAAQLHGAILEPPPGRTSDEVLDGMLTLWTRALTPPP